jgi:hypothetical protein
MPGSTVLFIIVCLTIPLYFLKRLLHDRQPPLPPGPSTISLICQAFRSASLEEEDIYSKLAPKYGLGPLFFCRLLGTH